VERERAMGRLLAEKLRVHTTKQTVLNQQMLHPATRQTKNTCYLSATHESESLHQLIIFIFLITHIFSSVCALPIYFIEISKGTQNSYQFREIL
jgi:hypothetical protein